MIFKILVISPSAVLYSLTAGMMNIESSDKKFASILFSKYIIFSLDNSPHTTDDLVNISEIK
jgi:hypothetical protein